MADVLAFEGVSVEFTSRRGTFPILDDVSFSIGNGEAFGLVGESGCGKSTIALATMQYLAAGMRLTRGGIMFEGRNLASLGSAELRSVRGNRIAMVYQDPMSSLNPVMTSAGNSSKSRCCTASGAGRAPGSGPSPCSTKSGCRTSRP